MRAEKRGGKPQKVIKGQRIQQVLLPCALLSHELPSCALVGALSDGCSSTNFCLNLLQNFLNAFLLENFMCELTLIRYLLLAGKPSECCKRKERKGRFIAREGIKPPSKQTAAATASPATQKLPKYSLYSGKNCFCNIRWVFWPKRGT